MLARRLLEIGAALALCVQPAPGQDAPTSQPDADSLPSQVLWGDTHVHTRLSGDAYSSGTRLGLDEAYRFARGEEVTSSTGQRARLGRPLDFLVVADHGNNAGAAWARDAAATDPDFARTPIGRLWRRVRDALARTPGVDPAELAAGPLSPTHLSGQISVRDAEFRSAMWDRIVQAADRYNAPGSFTTFSGYEWTPERGTVHRVVVFRDGAETVGSVLPLTSFDTENVEELWRYLESYETSTGGAALAIPHNSNLTDGMMFALVDSYGRAIDADYGRARARWEPLLEVTQIKGDSETHPFLSPDDEFADYETWNGWDGPRSDYRPSDRIRYEYARSALLLGLGVEADHGVNPFKFGMIGSSDSHTGLAAVAEDDFWGKAAFAEPSAGRMFSRSPFASFEASAAGYAAVWATENTRQAIFDALRRREVYASTGPRIRLRFFGGWGFQAGDAQRGDLAQVGYRGGVPMGADLESRPAEGPSPTRKAPRFLIHALKDPIGANLDRVQVVKGWRTATGELEEKVYDVAWSGDRRPDADGRLPPVGSTVDVSRATYSNRIGSAELAVVWEDPDFDAAGRAFYYVRVLEIPTPRWTAYDAARYGLGPLPAFIPTVTQERVYSSPIWYAPPAVPSAPTDAGANHR